MNEQLKTYEVCVEIQAAKWLVLKARSEEEALDLAAEICENTTIPIEPEDEPVIWPSMVEELENEDEVLDGR